MKYLFFILMILSSYSNLFAQIYVDANGYVRIGEITSGNSQLRINGDVYVPGPDHSYWINSTSDAGTRLRMHVNTNYGAFFDFYPCLWFRTSASGGVTQTPLFIQSSNGYVGMNTTTPQYQLDVNGLIRANNVSVSSDIRFKNNVKNLNSSIDSLFLLQGVTYNLKWPLVSKTKISKISSIISSDTSVTMLDTIGKNSSLIAIDSALYNRRHIGFIAQEVQKIFPELVYQDKNGILSVDYISIIPLLVEALKQERKEINYLKQLVKNENLKLGNMSSDSTNIDNNLVLSLENTARLSQNVPNPFNKLTIINYYLPKTISTAEIYIYDMNGAQIKAYQISSFGNGSIVINGYELKPGMYFYTLIADNQEVATKRMILTK
jgi:hypothetical protein